MVDTLSYKKLDNIRGLSKRWKLTEEDKNSFKVRLTDKGGHIVI